MAARAATVIAAAAATVLLVTGCGTTDEPAERAEHFHRALDDGDGAGACADLAEETRTALEHQEKKPCEEAITSLTFPDHGGDADAEVFGSMAHVQIGDETVFLSRFDDGWRVVAAGCPPTSGDKPHDCELEGG